MRLLPSVFLAVLFLAVPSLASAQSGQILDNALRRAEQIQKLKAMDEAREREQERHKAECAARTDAEAQEPTEPPRELPPREELQATIMEMRQRRVQLFNNCEQMSLSVQFMSKDSAIANIEDIEDRIQTMAESRLRAARLFTDSASKQPVRRPDRFRASVLSVYALREAAVRRRERPYVSLPVVALSSWKRHARR